jgi:hypothetical protein
MNSMAPMSTPRRGLADEEEVGAALDLARDHDLLLVATREALRGKERVRRAHVEAGILSAVSRFIAPWSIIGPFT